LVESDLVTEEGDGLLVVLREEHFFDLRVGKRKEGDGERGGWKEEWEEVERAREKSGGRAPLAGKEGKMRKQKKHEELTSMLASP
jgi:hypothetical protein